MIVVDGPPGLVFHDDVRLRGLCIHTLVVLAAAAGCQKEAPTTAPTASGCTGARCVEEAEAAMFYGDHEHAREPLKAVCNGGDGFQCYRLAELYHHGKGGPVDIDMAVVRYEDACKYDYGEACERRAELAREGEGGPPVELEFEIKACKTQRPAACARAGQMLARGRGVEPDKDKAVDLFGEGCKLGEVDGCTGAADILSDPEGPADAKARSLALFISACTGHSGYGCLKVGLAFHNGDGAKQNLESARIHFAKACTYAEEDGCQAAKLLEASGGKPVDLVLTTRAAELAQDGLETRSVSCRMSDLGPHALGAVMSAVAANKPSLEACVTEGTTLAVAWDFDKGRVRDAKVRDKVPPKLSKCVVAALKKAKVDITGNCKAVLLLGDPEGAAKSLAERVAAQEAKAAKAREDRHAIRVSHDDED